MSEINVPSVTIPQMHSNLTALSGTDLVPLVQGSEYDRDAAATLSEILASNPFQDQKEWKTFLLSAAALDTGTWTHNALVLLDAWESSISYSGTSIKNGIMILIPKWSAAPEGTTSCTFAETEGTTCQILRGNFLLIRFGLDGKISSYFSIPASSVDAIAQLKNLSVSGSLSFPAGSISEAMLATGAVSKEKISSGALWPKHLKASFFSLAGDVYAMIPTGAEPEYTSLLINALAVKPSHLSPAVMVKATTPIPVVFNYDGSTWAGMDKSFLLDLTSFGTYLDGNTIKNAIAAGDIITAKIWVRGAASTGTANLRIGSPSNYVLQDIDISSSSAITPVSYSKSYTITADDITRGWIQITSFAELFDGDISVNITLAKGA